MTVTLKPNTEITVPKSIRRKAGITPGDEVEFRVSGRVISIIPSDDDYTPAERRAIDRGIDLSEKEYREGRSAGPFNTHEEFIAALHAAGKKPGAKQPNRRP
jgi:AbrB family looped-hinge helix DNA binding protein